MTEKKSQARSASRHRGQPPTAHRLCIVPGCGRGVYARQLCQTHHRQLVTSGELKAIRPYRRRSAQVETVKYSGLRLTPGCAAEISRFADSRALSPSAVIVDILEEWYSRGARPPRPTGVGSGAHA